MVSTDLEAQLDLISPYCCIHQWRFRSDSLTGWALRWRFFSMALNAAKSGGRVLARRGGGGCGNLFGLAAASALSASTSTAAATTPQRISHYLAHHPRATWEALSAAFPAAAAAPHGHHLDAVLLSLAKHRYSSSSSPELVARNALTFFYWSASSSSSTPHSLRAYCLLVHLLSRAALIRDASVLLKSAIAKHSSSSPVSAFLDAFFAAYEDSGTAATTRGLHLLVHAYARARLPEEALQACRYLAQRGVLPSLSAFNAVLHAAQRSGRFGVAWEVFELMTLKRVYANQSTVELVIGVLSREGALARMAALVERIHGKKCAPGVVAHVALTLRIFEDRRTEQGILLLRRMLQRNMVFDSIAYSLIVHAHCQAGDLKSACEQRGDMVRRGCRLNSFVYTCLIRVHCREGDVDEAMQLFEEMISIGLKPYDATYSHLTAGCFIKGRMKEGSEYMDKMVHQGFVPDIGTCNDMLEALCDSGEVNKANELLTAVMDKGFVPDQNTYLRLMNGYGKTGYAEGIIKTYHEMEHRGLNLGVDVFSSLIRALCQCGNLKEAEKFLAVLERKLLAPTSEIYDLLISGNCEKGNTKKALWFYDRMMTGKDKLVPSADTFMMLVRRVIKPKFTLLMSPGSPSKRAKEGTLMLEPCLPDFAIAIGSVSSDVVQAAALCTQGQATKNGSTGASELCRHRQRQLMGRRGGDGQRREGHREARTDVLQGMSLSSSQDTCGRASSLGQLARPPPPSAGADD
uniref:Pentacotripeptide-repeat region of PRORP domain-containing protein n=1 Tax=Oryza punctata TaxID=4537 RepID=A0A0E0JEM4_ORYPU